MNKYTQYLQKNWKLLGALQWLWFERRGRGVLYLKDNRVYFGFYDDLNKQMKGLCDRRSPQTYVIVRFDDGFVTAFQPPKSPPECFKMMKPQLKDFIADSSKGIEID